MITMCAIIANAKTLTAYNAFYLNLKNFGLINKKYGKKEADLITVEVLPNEGPNVGGIYDTDGNSFCGCLNQCLRFLQETPRRR